MTEKTLAIIKPDAVKKGIIGKIIGRIEDEGFKITAMKMAHLSKDDAKGFYIVHKSKPFYDSLTNFMSSGRGCRDGSRKRRRDRLLAERHGSDGSGPGKTGHAPPHIRVLGRNERRPWIRRERDGGVGNQLFFQEIDKNPYPI